MITVNLSACTALSHANAQVAAVRYAWLPIPNTQLLFDNTMLQPAGLHGLPAPPFWANCSTTTCTLIPPGHLPDPAPPPSPPPTPPSKPQCPRRPLPSDGKCDFINNTRLTGTPIAKLEVDLNDYEACCAKCVGNASCHAAAMSHGPQSASYDFCWLYSSRGKPLQDEVVCPVLAVTLLPK